MRKGIKLVKGTVFEIDPTKRYLVIFDRQHISPADVRDLGMQMHNESLLVLINGNPQDVKVIEDNRKATEAKE